MRGNFRTENVMRRNFLAAKYPFLKHQNAPRTLKYATYPHVRHLPSNTLRTLKYPRYAVCSVPAYPVLFLVSPVRSLRTGYADICHIISVVQRNLPSWNTTGETSKSMKLSCCKIFAAKFPRRNFRGEIFDGKIICDELSCGESQFWEIFAI